MPLHSLNIVATDIAPIRSTAHYRRMVTTLEALLEEAAGDERHPAMGLVDIVGDLIADYESQNASLPKTTGVHALKFLMDQHGIKQGELQAIGSQGVVSEILAGKCELNIRQVRALAKRFGVSVATFVDARRPPTILRKRSMSRTLLISLMQ